MSEETKEHISALVDNEFSDRTGPAIDGLLDSASLKGSWSRYHLISDILKNNMSESIDSRLVQRISASIRDEPTILAPRSEIRHTYIKPLAGFAIAASVAALAILGIQQNQTGIETQQQQIVSFTAQKSPARPAAQLASARSSAEEQLSLREANNRARLNSYLVNYNEQRINSGFQGMLPYVRTVTFENDQ